MIGQVAGIWRYPVKSMRGEHVTAAAVDDRGLVGDRLFAVRDAEGKFGSGKNTRRFRRMDGLLDFQARYIREPGPQFLAELTCPDGSRYQVGGPEADHAVRAHLGRADVALLPEQSVSHFDDGPIHLLSTASVGWLAKAVPDVAVDERRLRRICCSTRTPSRSPRTTGSGAHCVSPEQNQPRTQQKMTDP